MKMKDGMNPEEMITDSNRKAVELYCRLPR